MMVAPANRWSAVVAALNCCILIHPSICIYSGDDDCYDLLGQNEEERNQRRMNNHSDAEKITLSLVGKNLNENSGRILKDEATREQYDYAIAHPGEVFYNTARYYQAYYGHKTDPLAILVGLLLFLSAFQYLNQWTSYNQPSNKTLRWLFEVKWWFHQQEEG
ncbi:hypothetical protein RJ641_001988 [Dillenia turbinata]|uniref:J domain-containing protein n=1 Tax=Dillenia turbinata TaxID=194707 RepID=A0AAN8VF58_9MAGN